MLVLVVDPRESFFCDCERENGREEQRGRRREGGERGEKEKEVVAYKIVFLRLSTGFEGNSWKLIPQMFQPQFNNFLGNQICKWRENGNIRKWIELWEGESSNQ